MRRGSPTGGRGRPPSKSIARSWRPPGSRPALTPQEFVRVAGGSLGTVRKWERGERSPSGAARMLARILARDPALVIAEAGLAEGTRKRSGGEAGLRDKIA
jgi:hypothetical protein